MNYSNLPTPSDFFARLPVSRFSALTYKYKWVSALIALSLSSLLMGNQSCKETPIELEKRSLLRRVQLGKISAPPMRFQDGSQFDFAYVANAQMYGILKKTKSFSTATIDPNNPYDPSGLLDEEGPNFNHCEGDLSDQGEVGQILVPSLNPELYSSTATSSASLSAKTVYEKLIFSTKAPCLIEYPHGIVNGSILDFTLVSATSVNANLAKLSIPFVPGLKFGFKKYELSLIMNVTRPLSVDKFPIANTEQFVFQSAFDAEAVLDFGMIQLGPKYYYQTPLRQVVDNGLTSGVEELKNKWNETEPWYAMIIKNCDKYIYINAGGLGDSGIKVNDILKVHNVQYVWQGPVCKSYLHSTLVNQEAPLAYVKIISVGDNIAKAKIIENDPMYPHKADKIEAGARVYIEKLIEPVPSPISKK